MWWLLGLLAFIATAASESSQESGVGASPPARQGRSLTYLSHDQSSYFRFSFVWRGEGIRIYILACPSPELGSCHVLRDSFGPYICWTDPITSIPAAEIIAAVWAERTLIFQRTGQSF